MAKGMDSGFHPGRQVGRAHFGYSNDGMGTTDLNTLVKANNPAPAGAMPTSGNWNKVYNAPTGLRGYEGHAAYEVHNDMMPSLRTAYRDFRTGGNASGSNPQGAAISTGAARRAALGAVRAIGAGSGAPTATPMIQDAYGRPTKGYNAAK